MWTRPTLQQSLRADRRGVTALQYALVAGALSGLLVAAFTVLGGDLQTALIAAAANIPGI